MLEKQLMTSESRLQEQLDINDQLRMASAELGATIDALRVNVQGLSGRLEEVDFSIQRGSRSVSDTEDEIVGRVNRVDEIARSNKDRIAAVEQYLDLEMTSTDAAGDAAAVPVSDQLPAGRDFSEAELYLAGKQAFDNGQYEIVDLGERRRGWLPGNGEGVHRSLTTDWFPCEVGRQAMGAP